MKKQKYVDRINNCDRYLNKIGSVIDNLEMVLIQDPNDRITYLEFKDKHMNKIKELVSTPPMSPSEQKYCVFQITVNYPEIISPDNDVDYKLWPWFGISGNGLEKMYITNYGESVIRSFIREQRSVCCSMRCFFSCCFKGETFLVKKYYDYFNDDKDIDVSALNPPEKIITFNVGDKISFIKDEYDKIFHHLKSKKLKIDLKTNYN